MFRTELSIRPAAQLLASSARVLTIGSCFSDVIGERLGQHKVETLTNPFGTVFNPLAAARLLRAVAGEDTDWQQHLVQARGRWQSYDLHATIGADSPPALLSLIEQTVRETTEFARTADVLVWTLGTAYAYRLRDTGEVVNNCHKVPAERFEKELLTAEEIVSAVTEAYALLRQRNPKLRLVLTVSPVRHLKDTLPLNAVSKSVLRVACHYLSELLPGASYFPSYELLLDDLRDYRFYGADMLHPSDLAEQYIWDKFIGAYFDSSFKQFVQEWAGIQRALNHRPIFEGAPEHRAFLEQTQQRLQRLVGRVDVRAELRDVEQRIAALPLPPVPEPEPELNDGEERIDIGYEDATALTSPRLEVPVAAEPPKREPSWAEILSAEAAEEEEDAEPEDEVEGGQPDNEAAAALPGDADKKRRKRKRGGRKHKKKGNRQEEGVDTSATEADMLDADETVSIEDDTSLATEVPDFAATEPASTGVPELPATELTDSATDAAQQAPPATKSKRRNRGGRKKTALYAEQPVLNESLEPAGADVVPEMAPEAAPAAPATAVAELLPADEATSPEPFYARTPEPESSPAASEATPEVPPVSAPQLIAPAEVGSETPATPELAATGEPAPIGTASRKGRRTGRGSRSNNRVTPALEAAAEALPQPPPVVAEQSRQAEPAAPEPQLTPAPEAVPAAVEPAVTTSEMTGAGAATESVAPKKRAAPRRKPKAAATSTPDPAPEPAATPPAPANDAAAAPAAPKRRPRPPRRKPEGPTDAS